MLPVKGWIMTIEENLRALGLTLPQLAKPVASYVPAVRTGNLVYCSGQLPFRDGKLQWTGQVGDGGLAEESAIQAAQLAGLNCLSAVQSMVGDLEKVSRVIRVNGFVSSAPLFTNQPRVINGASDLLMQLFGERGQHSRVAVGVSRLPLDAPVEIDMIVEISD
jgi:enamine deaminase RidA (YjgF/YER057c/UK114 family)